LFFWQIAAQCDGSCQTNTDSCPTAYKSGLCPGASNIECCTEQTPNCPGQCQTNTVTCNGNYVTGLCPGPSTVACCKGTQPFGDRQWNCANPPCSSVVAAGSSQPNYECAEFVARALAAGGLIPNIDPLASQSSYGNYHYNNVVYDLLWVSSKQGGPLGLGDLLLKMGWINEGANYGSVKKGSALMCDGSDGAYSHAALGVGTNLVDAHNNARYHVTASYYTINAVYNPPALLKNYTLEEAGPLPDALHTKKEYPFTLKPSN